MCRGAVALKVEPRIGEATLTFMSRIHHLSGEFGSPEQERQYADYYSMIAHQDSRRIAPHITTYQLRPEIGRGSIETTQLVGGMRVIRYNVTFAIDHQVDYRFSENRFELEGCIDGQLRIKADDFGQGTIGPSSSTLSPPRSTVGILIHPAGQRYRGVSLTCHRASLGSYVGSIGGEQFASSLGDLDRSRGDELYLGRGPRVHGLSNLMAELFNQRAETSGKTLLMEARVSTALALLAEASANVSEALTPGSPESLLEAHEVAILRQVPHILWDGRFESLTLVDVARQVSMSPKRLAQGYRLVFGTTPMVHHRNQCLDRAAEMLVNTDWTVARIGSEVGYSSASNFIFAFRRRQGCTPVQYRSSRK